MISQPCQELEDPVIVSLGVNVDVPLLFKWWRAPGIQRDVSKASPGLSPGLEVCSLDCRPSWWPPPKTCAAFDHNRQRCRLQWSGEQRPSLKRGIQYPSQYPLSGEEESCLIGQLGDHVGVVRVGKVEAAVAVRKVLQYQMFNWPQVQCFQCFPMFSRFCNIRCSIHPKSNVFTSKCGFRSVITGIFSPETTPTEVTRSGFSWKWLSNT